jgi:hypothetical protein
MQENAADLIRTRFLNNTIFVSDTFVGDRVLLFDQIGRMRRVRIGKNKQQCPVYSINGKIPSKLLQDRQDDQAMSFFIAIYATAIALAEVQFNKTRKRPQD